MKNHYEYFNQTNNLDIVLDTFDPIMNIRDSW